jgi:imidazolonepropionase-like amidohydrolase
MTRAALIQLGALAAAALLAGSPGRAQPPAGETLAIVHARAWTNTGAATHPLDDATIVVRAGKIVSVAAGLAPPPGAKVIDANGRLVTPGLMNASTQLGLVEVSDVDQTADDAVKASPLGAAFDIQYALNPNSESIAIARADGLTRAIAAPTGSGSSPFAGRASLLHLEPGQILERPRAAMFVAIGGGSASTAGGSRSAQWQLLRNALDETRRYRLRPHTSLTPRDQLLNHLDAEALEPVLDRRTPLVVAADRESDIRQAVQLGQDYGVRVIIQGGAEAWRTADLLAAHDVPVILDPFANLPTSFDEIGARLDNAARLQRAGVLIAFAQTDTFTTLYRTLEAGLALRESAGLAVANGLSWADALKAITLNPARMFGISEQYGELAPAHDADLVIWHGDPLDVSGWPDLVLVDGQQVSQQTRQTLLRDRYAPDHRPHPFGPAYP